MHRSKFFSRLLLIVALYSVGLTGCGDQTRSNEMSEASALSEKNEQTNTKQSWWKRESKESKLQKELSAKNRQLEMTQRELEESNRARERTDRIIRIASIVGGSVLALVFLWVAYVMCRKPKHNGTGQQSDGNLCPRCGWERTSGESICRNCKTQF